MLKIVSGVCIIMVRSTTRIWLGKSTDASEIAKQKQNNKENSLCRSCEEKKSKRSNNKILDTAFNYTERKTAAG